ncbi:hypothetical protein ACFLYI_02535 [Chloroflexota bacterium]
MQKRYLRGHVRMILYNIPSVILAIIAVVVIGFEFGWDTLIKLPFNLLIGWLIFAVIFVFFFRWLEVKEEEQAYEIGLESFKQEVEAVKEGLKEAIVEAIKEGKK